MRNILRLFSKDIPVKGKNQISGIASRKANPWRFYMKSENIFLAVFVSLVLVVSGASAQTQVQANQEPTKLWSLEDCIHYALQNNITIKQTYLQVKSSKANLLQSKLNFLPSFSASGNESSSWGRALDYSTYQYTNSTSKSSQFYMSVSGNITLFSGLQNENKLRLEEFNYLASKYNSDEIKDNISLNIAAAYLQILYNIEQVKNAKRQLESTEEQINLTKKEVDVGKVARGNLLQVEAQGASDKVNLVTAKNNLMLAYLDLKQLLDLKASTPFDVQKPSLVITHNPKLLPISYIYNTAIGIMPQIKNAEYNVKAAGASLAMTRGQRSPSLSLFSQYGNNYSNVGASKNVSFWQQMHDHYSINLGFSLSIPIFNHFQISNAITQSKISLENAKLTLENQKNTLRKNIEQAYTDALAAYQTYEASLKSVESLKESFKYAKEKFNVGLLSSTDYTVAKNNYYNAESTLTSEKYDYIFKTKILDFYLGKSLSLKDIATQVKSTK